jgi:hypothetical protein
MLYSGVSTDYAPVFLCVATNNILSSYHSTFVNTRTPYYLFCGLSSFKPGDSLYWEVAWTRLGSCNGTMRPTASPVHVDLIDVGGCSPEFSDGVDYSEGDQVRVNDIVMQCKGWPHSVYCSHEGYEPLSLNSDAAWITVGHW